MKKTNLQLVNMSNDQLEARREEARANIASNTHPVRVVWDKMLRADLEVRQAERNLVALKRRRAELSRLLMDEYDVPGVVIGPALNTTAAGVYQWQKRAGLFGPDKR